MPRNNELRPTLLSRRSPVEDYMSEKDREAYATLYLELAELHRQSKELQKKLHRVRTRRRYLNQKASRKRLHQEKKLAGIANGAEENRAELRRAYLLKKRNDPIYLLTKKAQRRAYNEAYWEENKEVINENRKVKKDAES